jgi:uncharacterized protein
MKIVIAGASGLIGSALVPALREQGHEVFRLVRREARAPDEVPWNPAAGELRPGDLAGTDGIVNLAGENIAARWTRSRREAILRSRVDATRTLAGAMGQMPRKPAVFVSASGINIYGTRGEEVVTETQGAGRGFLAEVCVAWETEARAALRHGVRTAMLRFGMVLAGEGGALGKMLPPFRLGLGGRLGGGEQWMSWVSIDDVVGVISQALVDPRYDGAINVVAPQPVTNAEFTRTLAGVLRRPAFFPVPAPVLRLLFGGMADEALLASLRVAPRRLQEIGHRFRHPSLEGALRAAIQG